MKPMKRAIVFGGLTAGTGDFIFAISFYGVKPQVFQTVAAAVIGREAAYAGGAATFALGTALHYAIALVWAALFCLAGVRWPALLRHAVPSGLVYGLLVYAVMNHVVLPLSALHVPAWPPHPHAPVLAAHAFLFGLPIALAARRALLGGPVRRGAEG